MIHNGFNVDVHKTDIVEVSDKSHGLPASRGVCDSFKVADYFCPDNWSKDGFFITLPENSPFWFDFRMNGECACLPFIQKVNPLTMEQIDLEKGLSKDPKQNYMVLPIQRWLDGYANDGIVYQFILTKSGIRMAVNENVLPVNEQNSNAIGFAFFGLKNPKPITPVRTPDYSSDLKSIKAKIEELKHKDDLKEWSTLRSKMNHYYDANAYYWPKYVGNGYYLGDNVCIGSSAGSMDSLSDLNTKGLSGDSPSSGHIFLNSSTSPRSLDFDMADVVDVFNSMCNEVPMDLNCDPYGYKANLGYCSLLDECSSVDEHQIQSQHTDFDKSAVGAGGRIEQSIENDTNSVDYYHEKPDAILNIYAALPEQFEFIMAQGKRQDAKNRKDKEVAFGNVGANRFPLISVAV